MRDGHAPQPSPYPPDLSWFHLKRRNDTGSSRMPSRPAHRARPIRQYRDDATLSRLLPPSPPIHGSGCLQLHPPLRRLGDGGLSPPFGTTAPHGALPVLAVRESLVQALPGGFEFRGGVAA